jgi:tripartite-type tricarboxylate transporter receptor subunit TctC
MAAFPDVPTFKELGYDLVGGAYRGVAVPSSTPEELRQRISDIISEINKRPDFVKKMEEGGFFLTDVSYDKMDAFMAERKADYAEGAEALDIGK